MEEVSTNTSTVAFTTEIPSEPDYEEEEYEYQDGDEAMEAPLVPTTIEIYHEDDTDIIRLATGDSFGEVILPFYAKIDDVDVSKTMPSMADDRNGMFDFPTHLVPLIMFLWHIICRHRPKLNNSMSFE